MRSFIAQACLLAVLADARRSRRDRRRDDDDGQDDFPDNTPNMDRVVWDPQSSHDTLPYQKFMAPNERDVDAFFMDWASTYGSSKIHTAHEAEIAKDNWKKTNRKVRQSFLNSLGKANAPVLKHNQFSAMSDDELSAITGGKLTGTRSQSNDTHWSSRGRNLEATESIYWGEKYIGPVKDQGNCGSCWTFGATTPLEGQIVAAYERQGIDMPWQGLSNQMLLDCSSTGGDNAERFGRDLVQNAGCNGGYIDSTYEFMKEWGVMSEADYPYSGVQSACTYRENEVVADIIDWGQVASDPASIAAKLADGPLEVGMAITNDFGFFDGEAILGPDDTEYCGRGGHVISIVGYEPGTGEGGTEIVEVLNGRYSWRWWTSCEDYEFRCAWNMCCWYEEEERPVSGDSYFILQNQWGASWADQGRYKVSADANGNGWCGWQNEVFYSTPDLS